MCGNKLLAALLMAVVLPAGADTEDPVDTIDEFQKAKREQILRELNQKAPGSPQQLQQNLQPTAQEVLPVFKGSYGSASDPRRRWVVLGYEKKRVEARAHELLPGGWRVVEIGTSHAKIQKGGVTRYLDVKKPETGFPAGAGPSIFQPIN